MQNQDYETKTKPRQKEATVNEKILHITKNYKQGHIQCKIFLRHFQ